MLFGVLHVGHCRIQPQHTHEKMLHVLRHQGNEHENHSEVPVHTHESGCYLRKPETTFDKDVKKLELSCTETKDDSGDGYTAV